MESTVENNTIVITKERIEAAGKLASQQSVLNDMKAIISSMIDSVRGDDVLIISCEIKKVEKEKKVVNKSKQPVKAKPKTKAKSVSNSGTVPNKAKPEDAGSGKSGKDNASGKKIDQEIDPLSENTPENK